jgi:hypothetical protein
LIGNPGCAALVHADQLGKPIARLVEGILLDELANLNRQSRVFGLCGRQAPPEGGASRWRP